MYIFSTFLAAGWVPDYGDSNYEYTYTYTDYSTYGKWMKLLCWNNYWRCWFVQDKQHHGPILRLITSTLSCEIYELYAIYVRVICIYSTLLFLMRIKKSKRDLWLISHCIIVRSYIYFKKGLGIFSSHIIIHLILKTWLAMFPSSQY